MREQSPTRRLTVQGLVWRRRQSRHWRAPARVLGVWGDVLGTVWHRADWRPGQVSWVGTRLPETFCSSRVLLCWLLISFPTKPSSHPCLFPIFFYSKDEPSTGVKKAKVGWWKPSPLFLFSLLCLSFPEIKISCLYLPKSLLTLGSHCFLALTWVLFQRCWAFGMVLVTTCVLLFVWLWCPQASTSGVFNGLSTFFPATGPVVCTWWVFRK